jgi:hypothetical protein
MDDVRRALDLVGPYFARMSARERLELCGHMLIGMSPPDPYMSRGGQPQMLDQADLEVLRRIVGVISAQMMAPPDPADDSRPKTTSALICPCCGEAISVSLTCVSGAARS